MGLDKDEEVFEEEEEAQFEEEAATADVDTGLGPPRFGYSSTDLSLGFDDAAADDELFDEEEEVEPQPGGGPEEGFFSV